MALQIARHAQGLGVTQVAAARLLGLPQPTLSKIANGRVDELSLELLLRVAVRAGLRLTLQTGRTSREAGAFVGIEPRARGRKSLSRIAVDARASLQAGLRNFTPSQRVEAFLQHNELMSELRQASVAAEAPGGRRRR